MKKTYTMITICCFMIALIISCSVTRIQVKGENKGTKIKIGIGFIERNKRFYKYKEKDGEIEANTKMEYLDGRETYLITSP